MHARTVLGDATSTLNFLDARAEQYTWATGDSAPWDELFGIPKRNQGRMRATGRVTLQMIETIADHVGMHPVEIESTYYELVAQTQCRGDDQCENPHKSGGLCRTHYRHWVAAGKPDAGLTSV